MMAEPEGTVLELWRYPVKSLGGERLDAVALGALGVDGDRRWAVCERATGKALTAKRVATLLLGSARTEGGADVVVRLPDGTEHVAGQAATDEAVSTWLDLDVVLRRGAPEQASSFDFPEDPFDDDSPATEIVTLPGAFFDATPLHVLTTASLAAMGRAHPDGVWSTARFRPNIVVESTGDGFVEEGWLGTGLTIGSATILPVSPCPRCAMTTRAQPGLDRDVAVLRTINAANAGSVGIYAVVTAPGRVTTADRLTPAPG